jgi:hypothetical protein
MVLRALVTLAARKEAEMVAPKTEKKAKRMRGRARAEIALKPAVIEGPSSSKPPTLSPGVKLSRVYKGKKITVVVMEGGKFECAGQFFTSLSAVANHITKSHVSGNAWFGLKARPKKGAAK